MDWQPIETAPKGTPGRYARGPDILGVCVGSDWVSYNVVSWRAHKDGVKGNWFGHGRVWSPTHWMPLPPPPTNSTPTKGD